MYGRGPDPKDPHDYQTWIRASRWNRWPLHVKVQRIADRCKLHGIPPFNPYRTYRRKKDLTTD